MTLPVFVINLENDRDSWETVAESVRRYGQDIDLRRIDAIDGRRIETGDYEGVDLDLFRRRNGRDMLAGEYGCYKSHLKALRRFLDTDMPYGLILEDDVLFNARTEGRIQAIIEALPDLGAIKLVNHRHRYMIGLGETRQGDRIGRTMHGPQGSAAAYLVSRDGAQRLLHRLETMSLPWDVALERFWDNGADVFSADADVLDFSPHRARSTIAEEDGYGRVKYSRHRRLGAAVFRFREIFARAWNVMLQPSQSASLPAPAARTGPAALKASQDMPMPSWGAWLVGIVMLAFVSAVWVETDAYRYAGLALVCAALVRYFWADFWTYDKPLVGWAGLLCMGWAAWVALRYAYVAVAHPDHGTGTAEGIYILTILYPTFGYGLYLFMRRPFQLSLAFLAISLVVLLFGADYGSARAVTHLQNNTIHAAVASGIIAMCALPFALYALRRPGLTAAGRVLTVALALATFLAALFAIVEFLSKGVWLAIAIALPVTTLIAVVTERSRRVRWAAVAGFLLALAGAVAASERIYDRTEDTVGLTAGLVSDIASGNGFLASIDKAIADPAAPASERERLMLWANALHQWAERPVFGSGISWQHYWKDRPYQETRFTLLHNGYLEIAVRYGVVGLAFYTFLAVWAFVRILQATRAGLVDAVVLQCYCGTMVFFALTILSNSNIRLAIGESYTWMAASTGFYCYFLLQRHGLAKPRTIF